MSLAKVRLPSILGLKRIFIPTVISSPMSAFNIDGNSGWSLLFKEKSPILGLNQIVVL